MLQVLEHERKAVAVEAADDEQGRLGMTRLDHDDVPGPRAQAWNHKRHFVDRLHVYSSRLGVHEGISLPPADVNLSENRIMVLRNIGRARGRFVRVWVGCQRAVMASVFWSALAACGDSPTAVDDAELIEAFPWFAGAYVDMEECSSVDGDPNRVRWFGVLNYVQVSDDSLEVIRTPPFTVEWRRPHDVYVGVTRVEGGSTDPGSYVTVLDAMEGALRDILQTNTVPQSTIDACGIARP